MLYKAVYCLDKPIWLFLGWFSLSLFLIFKLFLTIWTVLLFTVPFYEDSIKFCACVDVRKKWFPRGEGATEVRVPQEQRLNKLCDFLLSWFPNIRV